MSRIASLLRASARASLTAACGLVLAGAAASCADLAGPDVDRQSSPFYYYEGEKIYLQVIPTVLTAVPEVAGDTARLRGVLADRGIAPDSMRPLQIGVPGHWLLHLPRETSARTAENAARALRLAQGVGFASAAYTPREAYCPLYLIDRLAVQFRAAADSGAIARLNAATGVRGETREVWGARTYQFPADLAATPLELAAHYYRHPLVQWAEADRVTTCLRLTPASSRRDYHNAMQ